MQSTEIADREMIVRRLHAALRAERRLGIAGHWSYDLARHTQLLRAYRSEMKALSRSGG